MTSPTTDPTPLSLPSYPTPSYDHTPETINALITHLASLTPPIRASTLPAHLAAASSTPHSPAPPHHLPKAIFYPTSTADVSAVVRACHERRVAVTAVSGGTSLPGALANVRGGVGVDFGGMDRVWGVGGGGEDGVDGEGGDLDVRVQVGVGWVELNEILKPKGLFFPVDPAPGAKIGGMIAMSCSGTNAYRYGTMKEWVLSITAVLADGSILKTRNRPRKSSAGYDLNHLIIGSEGTLALVTECVLKLTALPQNLHVAIITFPKMQNGVDTAVQILRSGHLLEAIELADAETIRAINHSGLSSESLSETPTLFLKFAGTPESVSAQIAYVEDAAARNGSTHFAASADPARIASIWGARKCVGNALVRMKRDPTDLFLSADAAVPTSNIANLITRSAALCAAASPQDAPWFCASVGHVGDGNVHTAIVVPERDRAAAEKVITQIQRTALELEGTVTGEHGVGLKLRDVLAEEVGEVGVGVMRRIKWALDPRGVLNPDKVVRLEAGV